MQFDPRTLLPASVGGLIPALRRQLNPLASSMSEVVARVVDAGQARTASWSDLNDNTIINDHAPRSANTPTPPTAHEIGE